LLWLSVLFFGLTGASLGQTTPTVNVHLSGISGEVEANVERVLGIYLQRDDPVLTEGRIRRLHQKAATEITRALQPFGYYRAKIDGSLEEPEPGQWRAKYIIEPGPKLLIGSSDIRILGDGKTDPLFIDFLQNSALNVGQVLNQERYEKFKDMLATLAAERGYFDARFIEHQLKIDIGIYTADVVLVFDTGARYVFGEVRFEQDFLDPELIARFVPFKPATDYSLEKLVELQTSLNDSDYFQRVELATERSATVHDEINVDVKLEPRRRHKYTLGGGYGTDTGARALFGWEVPLLNRYGHRFDTTARVSHIGNSLVLNYRIPVLDPRTDQVILRTSAANEKTSTSDSHTRAVSVMLAHGRSGWRENLSLSYQTELYTIGGITDRSRLMMPGINWAKVWADTRLEARQGAKLTFDLRGASSNFVSDVNFSQATLWGKVIVPFSEHGRLIGRGQLGATLTDDFPSIPATIRFFSGGTQSVRGYAYQSLGPRDASGTVVGAKNIMVGSIEYDYRFKAKWSGAVFFDEGNAVNEFNDTKEQGAGFGVRWYSPIGPVRIDIASALTREGRPWRLHLNIGPDL
jgi:translocation and assembly module TamA